MSQEERTGERGLDIKASLGNRNWEGVGEVGNNYGPLTRDRARWQVTSREVTLRGAIMESAEDQSSSQGL